MKTSHKTNEFNKRRDKTMTKNEILVNALKEYEEAHYMDYGVSWQRNINQMIVEAEDKCKKKDKANTLDNERLKTLLGNAIVCLEDEYGAWENWGKEELLEELGMTEEEYEKIMED